MAVELTDEQAATILDGLETSVQIASVDMEVIKVMLSKQVDAYRAICDAMGREAVVPGDHPSHQPS
jgi:hypothetical protein